MLIEGTSHQKNLVHYNKTLKLQHKGLTSVSAAYWRAFLKRNNHLSDIDTGTTHTVCHKEWITHLNTTNMYNLFYDVMDEASVLEKLEEPVWMNLNEEIVENKEEAHGEKVRYTVKYHEYCVFVDEVGNNTNMKEYENVGGEKLLKKKGSKARLMAATNNTLFTVLGFTSGTGASVMCEIIFATHELNPEQQLGYDIRVDIVENDFSMRANNGPGTSGLDD